VPETNFFYGGTHMPTHYNFILAKGLY